MNDPLILYIETSTRTCSVALGRGRELLGARESNEEKAHSSMLTIFIDELLHACRVKPADLDAVCISKGPGSYTGLRIGVSVTKGIAYALNIPVIAINSLHALARGAVTSETVMKLKAQHPGLLLCPMIDARRMEVFAAILDLEFNLLRETSADIIDKDSYAAFLREHPVSFFGDGSVKLKDVLVHPNVRLIDGIQPAAANMIEPAIGAFRNENFVDTAYFEPFYLKDFVATRPRKKVL